MNVHHLELFYYVARHGGISPAVRQMPYGIQQPAVSGQIILLEGELGTKLFNRRPFALTAAGERLYQFIAPFFANLHEVGAELRGEAGARLRLAASAPVLRDHVPGFLHALRKRFPHVRPCLIEAGQAQAEELLGKQEIDVAITEIEGKPAAGLHALTLLKLPLVLLVAKNLPVRHAKDLWAEKDAPIAHPLIAFPERATITKLFADGLRRHARRRWNVSLEVNSLALVETYAAEGFGVGLSVLQPGAPTLRDDLRRLPLPGFAPMIIAALWQGKLAPLPTAFLGLVKARATALAASES